MGRYRKRIVDPKDYENVTTLFMFLESNSANEIAHRLNLKVDYVSYLIDCFLSLKNNYMGALINYPEPSVI